jgi:hypothetical protein
MINFVPLVSSIRKAGLEMMVKITVISLDNFTACCEQGGIIVLAKDVIKKMTFF